MLTVYREGVVAEDKTFYAECKECGCLFSNTASKENIKQSGSTNVAVLSCPTCESNVIAYETMLQPIREIIKLDEIEETRRKLEVGVLRDL
jgi:hypothetical protein